MGFATCRRETNIYLKERRSNYLSNAWMMTLIENLSQRAKDKNPILKTVKYQNVDKTVGPPSHATHILTRLSGPSYILS